MATIPALQTFIAGEKLAAAKLNQVTRDATAFLLNPPRATMTRNGAAQSWASTGGTAGPVVPVEATVIFDAEALDTDNMIDLVAISATAIRITTPGTYDITAYFTWNNSSTLGQRILRIMINGVVAAQDTRQAATSINTSLGVNMRNVSLAAGDLIRMSGWQNSGFTVSGSTAAGEKPVLTTRWVAQ